MRHVKFWTTIAGILIAAFLIFQWNASHFHLGYWLQVHTGTVNEPGPYYGFWSGFGSDIGEYTIIVTMSSGIIMAARRRNCHHEGCPWIGRYQVAGGQFKVCRRHHPDPAVRNKHVTMEHLHFVHAAHQENLRGRE